MSKYKQLDYELGDNMRRCRIEHGYSVRDLEIEADIGNNIIYNYESGHRKPRLCNLVKICDVLGVSIDEYIGREVKTE